MHPEILQTPLMVLGLLLALLVPASVQLTNCGNCLCDRPTITCDFDKSKTKIVENIDLTNFVPSSTLMRGLRLDPASYSELYINCKNARVLKEQRLTRELLRDFINLTRVSIVKCDLVAIDSDSLLGLAQLKELDFSDNQLERLPPGFLASKSLTVVRLSENRRLFLDADSFQEAGLERLVLSKCELTEFPLASLEKIRGLQELTLSQNRIQFVPSSARLLIDRLKVFYLDDNPLSCTCPNKWLREIPWDRVSPSLSKLPKGQLPRCKAPTYLQDELLTALSSSDFPCSPPQLLSVDLQVGSDSGRLTCTAKSEQPGLLVWTYSQYTTFPDALYGGVQQPYGNRNYQGTGNTFVQSFDRSRHSKQERYLISARTEDGRHANFTLTLEWPPKRQPVVPHLPGLINSNGELQSHLPLPPPQQPPQQLPPLQPQPTPVHSDYFSRKQFTLVEMIVAVIGTFLATALMFLLVCQFTRWYSRRDKKRWASYVTHPYGYSYSGVSQQPPPGPDRSSHEYDIPRIDQNPTLAKMSLTGFGGSGGSGSSGVGMTELEFLDYNGSGGHHRMMYNRV